MIVCHGDGGAGAPVSRAPAGQKAVLFAGTPSPAAGIGVSRIAGCRL